MILGILGSLEMLLHHHFAPKMHAITAKNSTSVPAKIKGKRSTYTSNIFIVNRLLSIHPSNPPDAVPKVDMLMFLFNSYSTTTMSSTARTGTTNLLG